MFNFKAIRLVFFLTLLLNFNCRQKNSDPQPTPATIDDPTFAQVARQAFFASSQSSTNLFGTFNQIQAPSNLNTARIIWSKDTSFKVAEDIAGFGKFTAAETWAWQVHYSDKLDSLTATVASKGNFDGDSIDFTDILKGSYTVTELANSAYFKLTGTITIDRLSQILRPLKTYELNSDIDLELRNFKTDKSTRRTISGELTLKLKGLIDRSVAYSRAAELSFDSANLLVILDNGRRYPYPRLRIKNK